MKIILFGATGMVGQGVLRECLLDDGIESVLAVGRSPTGQTHAKLRQLIHRDFTDFSGVAAELTGYDATFFCLGVSSLGMKEADYRHVTYDFTMAAARVLAQQNPGMTFIYVTGAGTDSTEKGKTMWARVKGETENALFKLPFKAAYMFRPGAIPAAARNHVENRLGLSRGHRGDAAAVPGHAGDVSRGSIATTEQVGRAMIAVARGGAEKTHLENQDIAAIAGRARPT